MNKKHRLPLNKYLLEIERRDESIERAREEGIMVLRGDRGSYEATFLEKMGRDKNKKIGQAHKGYDNVFTFINHITHPK